jgi:sarcosine oxidase subunit gamma
LTRKELGFVAEFKLTSEPPLGGIELDFIGASIRELSNHAIVSIAIPRDRKNTLIKAVRRAYGLELPVVGTSTATPANDLRLLGMQRDQILLMCNHTGTNPVVSVAVALGNAGYYSDQSDSWAILELSGPQCRMILERICPVNIAPDKFPHGAVTRTVMDHLGVIILRTGEDLFLLFSATSSASSFVSLMQTAAHNVL